MNVFWFYFSRQMSPGTPCIKGLYKYIDGQTKQDTECVSGKVCAELETEIHLGQKYGVSFSSESQVSPQWVFNGSSKFRWRNIVLLVNQTCPGTAAALSDGSY